MPSSDVKNEAARTETRQRKRRMNTNSLALTSCFLAIALIFSYIEMLLFPMVFPGVKLGLANIVVMFTFFIVGRRHAVAVCYTRVLISAILFGNASSFLFSLLGSTFSLVTLFLSLFMGKMISRMGVGVLSCAMNGVGQIIAAMIMYSSLGIIYYLPLLLITSVPFGVFGGILLMLIEDRLKRHYGGAR